MDLPSKDRATILVKAAPRVGKTHGETVCCAGIGASGNWVRLYPVGFRTLDDSQKFARWDVVEYDWRLPGSGDERIESRRVEHRTISIVGSVAKSKRQNLLARLVVGSLKNEIESGRSFALIRPENPRFIIEEKSKEVFESERELFNDWHSHEADGLFGYMAKDIVPYEPAPFQFKYKYDSADGPREGSCQDWEIEATFLKWRRLYGEKGALDRLRLRFGDEYAEKGFVLAMGTHKAYTHQWLINGVLRLDHGAEQNRQELLL